MAKKPAGTSRTLTYKRILLNLSGEVFSGSKEYGISAEVMSSIASEIKQLYALRAEIGIVIGGGNIFRGNSESAPNRGLNGSHPRSRFGGGLPGRLLEPAGNDGPR